MRRRRKREHAGGKGNLQITSDLERITIANLLDDAAHGCASCLSTGGGCGLLLGQVCLMFVGCQRVQRHSVQGHLRKIATFRSRPIGSNTERLLVDRRM